MAEIDNGGLFFKGSLDNSQLDAAIEETLRRIQGLSDGTAAAGDNIEDVFQKTADDIAKAFQMIDMATGMHQSSLRDLESEYDRLGKASREALFSGRDEEYRTLSRQQEAISGEIALRKELLKELEKEADALLEHERVFDEQRKKVEEAAQAHVTFNTQLRNVREELLLLEQAGQKNTERYRELEKEAGTLAGAISDVNKQTQILGHSQSGFQGVISGITGVSGGFAAATGAISLFADKNDDLRMIMVKIQSLMAITIGLQQVQETLYEKSAFSLVILSRAKNLVSASSLRLGTAFVRMGMSATAARIAVGALYAALTLGLSLAITGAIYAWGKYTDAQSKAAEASKKAFEVEKEALEVRFKSRIELERTIKEVKSFTGTKEEERKKVDELNQKYGESFGYYKTVAEWYSVLQKKGEDYIQMLFLQAKAQSLMQKAIEQDNLVNEINSKGQEEYRPMWGRGGKAYMFFGGSNLNSTFSDPAKIAFENAKKAGEELRDTYLGQVESLQNEIQVIRENGIGGFDEIIVKPVKKPTKEKKNEDPFAKELEERKKHYREYFNWVNAGFQKEADVEFASLLERGKTYKAYLQSLLDSGKLTREQIHRVTNEIVSETNASMLNDFKASLEDQMKNAGDVIERLQKIQEIRADLKVEAEKENADPLVDQKQDILEDYAKSASEDFDDESKKLLEKYRTFTQIRLDVEKQFQKEVKIMRQNGASEENIAIAQQQKDHILAVLDDEVAQKDVTFQAMMRHIGDMGIKQLEQSLRDAEEALRQSSVTNGDNATQAAVARATIRQLQEELKLAKIDEDHKNKNKSDQWDKQAKAIRNCKTEIDKMLDSMDFLDDSTKDVLQAASNIADGTIAMIDGIQVLAIGAAESISAVEKASVILAIIGAAIQIITSIFNMAGKAEKAHQEALAEVHANKLAMQREYNLALIEQNLLLKEAETIFGSDRYKNATNAINVYRGVLQQLDNEMRSQYQHINLLGQQISFAVSGLDSITIKTGHEKTGLFGWGKGRDIYTSITDVYDDLITAEGKLNVTRAKSILSTQTMSNANKEALQYMIDLAEKSEEAFEQVKGYLTDIFGELGNSMSDALTDAFKNGTDASIAFYDSVSGMLERLAQDMIYSVTLAPIMEKAQEQMLNILQNGNLSDEQKFNEYASLMGQLTKDAIAQKENSDKLYETYQAIANQNGIDIWKSDKDPSVDTSLTGAVTGVTEETASMLAGQINAIRINQVESTEIFRDQLFHLANIDRNTGAIDVNTKYIKSIYDKMSSGGDPLRSKGLGN